MPTIRFVSDPSLLRKDSKTRGLVLSTINSHIGKHKHEKNPPPLNPRRRRRGNGNNKVTSYALRQLYDFQALPVRLWLAGGVKPKYCDYLEQTYGATEDSIVVSRMFSYYVDVAGPLYVWNLTDAENRRSGHREHVMRLFMTEPAFIEAQLAWLYCSFDSARKARYTYKILYHQNKSITLVQAMLRDNRKIQDDSVLHTVLGNILINQACDDWGSFAINFSGLNQVIALTGGFDALKHRNPHTYELFEGLKRALDDRALNYQEKPATVPAAGTSVPSLRDHHALTQSSSRPSKTSQELVTLPQPVHDDVAGIIKQALQMLQGVRSPNMLLTADHTKQKNSIETILQNLVNERNLTLFEYSLCLGLLIKLASIMPFGEVRITRWTATRTLSLFSTFRKMCSAASTNECKGPILWTCLVILEMPLGASPRFSTRLSLLRDIMLCVSANLDWSEIRQMLSQIYLDSDLEIMWGRLWEKVLHQDYSDPFG